MKYILFSFLIISSVGYGQSKIDYCPVTIDYSKVEYYSLEDTLGKYVHYKDGTKCLDTTWKYFIPDTIYLTDSSLLKWGGISFSSAWEEPAPIYDTVKVIMLVCNTAIDTFQVTPQVGGNPYDYLDFDYSVKWQIGYEVIKSIWHRCCDPDNKLLAAPYFEYSHVEYLDAIKNPLRKNITVWMSKELK